MGLGNGASIVRSGLVLHLDAANRKSYPGTGTTWTNLSGGTAGTLTNGPIYNGTYFDFDGVDEYVNFGTITTLNPLQLSSSVGTGMTIMFASWFDTGGDLFQRIIDKSNGASALNGWAVYANSNTPNAGSMLFQDNASVGSDSLTIPVANTWEIWTYTWAASSGVWIWYKNGKSVNTGTRTYAVPTVQTNMRIGTWNHSTGRELNGRIAFMSIFNRSLSSTEVSQNFNATRGRYGI